jgi:hypothetical protein
MQELKKRNRLLEQENEILFRAAAYLARDFNPNDVPLIRDLAADSVPEAVTCKVLKFSMQGPTAAAFLVTRPAILHRRAVRFIRFSAHPWLEADP